MKQKVVTYIRSFFFGTFVATTLFSFVSLTVLPVLYSQLSAQSKDGFYDEYDMNLRNIPGGTVEKGEYEKFKKYQVPPKKKGQFAVTPKQVKRYYDPLAGIPGAGAGSLEALGNQGAGLRPQVGQQDQPLINPVTGELNVSLTEDSLLNQNEERKQKEREKKRFENEEIFPESKLRRFQIVFFLTLPFAFAVSAGVASSVALASASSANNIAASVIMITGTTGLSAANAYKDLQNLDEHKKKHNTEWHQDDDVAKIED